MQNARAEHRSSTGRTAHQTLAVAAFLEQEELASQPTVNQILPRSVPFTQPPSNHPQFTNFFLCRPCRCSCIPVVIQDGVEMELSSLLDVGAFSLRVAQADMERLPQILEAVPQERVRELQAALWRVWHRCGVKQGSEVVG
jgi:hypothetical protein